ncbi:MAG: hypothetical protein SFV22_13490 [Saprospiraceae bacterium]|nr:hypothetical protein [Saprospiraceae bacterium]
MKHFGYLLFIVSMFLFLACKDDAPTVVNATVVDKYTNEPLENVWVHIWVREDGVPTHDFNIYTNQDGFFTFGDEDHPDFSVYQMWKEGYVHKQNTILDFFSDYQAGKINEGIIQMIPEDGVLALEAKNVTGNFDSIFLRVFSPIYKEEFGLALGHVKLNLPLISLLQDQSYTQNISLASNQEVTVYWDTQPITTSTDNALKANVTILRHDTVYYTIEY